MLDKEAVHAIAVEVTTACRADVNREIEAVKMLANANALTDVRAQEIAEKAAGLAVKQITDNFYMGVGKKTLLVIGATVVVTWDQLKEGIKKAMGL